MNYVHELLSIPRKTSLFSSDAAYCLRGISNKCN